MNCAACALLLASIANGAEAQRRDAPLAQVKVPHSYYWREMYVPQITSGPGSAAWSPDGRELIYSMQGSLWRQALGSTTARQLTSSSNYDFQPDWSADGRSVVYVSYDGRTMALMLLDLASGSSRALLADSAVHMDPRWSPDGSRLAWVSTAHEGRWHVYVADYAASRLERITRVTEDRDGGLPRYYYSRYDHYLSPTWSPDGRDLIVVSNRDRIYGTGGLWRLAATPGSPMTRIHDEETTWRARPDWSRDGKRVVFSSYHGRQWNQLWITPSFPGEAIQLTYGDFDATAPRWSPDGSRIAYVSNEDGNTSLWTVAMPGGRRERIQPRERIYREQVGRLVLSTVDRSSGRTMPARVSVRGDDGRYHSPATVMRHADEAIVRDAERFEYGYWHSRGRDTLELPAGEYRVEVWRGPEWEVARRAVRVRPGETARAALQLERLANLAAQGWYGGDVHVHMNYGGAYRNTPSHLAHQARAEGLSIVHNLAVNKEQRIPDIEYWRPGLLHQSADVLVVNGQEFHTGLWGHVSFLGLREHFVLPDYAAYPGTALASLFPTNAAVFDIARAQGAVTGYVHPFDFRPDLAGIQGGVPYELPVDVATRRVDFLEVMGYSEHRYTSEVWYRLLNCGFRVAAAAGTDAFPNFASLRGPPGLVRTYAHAPGGLDWRRWLAALRSGRTFVTNGPLLMLTVNDSAPGSRFTQRKGERRTVRARITLRSAVPVDRVELVRNGVVVASLPGTIRDTTLDLAIDGPGWMIARASSERPHLPILDMYPFASTSPIYFASADGTVRCGDDAAYFIRWIDLLRERVAADTGWNTMRERDATLATLDSARAEFVRRR